MTYNPKLSQNPEVGLGNLLSHKHLGDSYTQKCPRNTALLFLLPPSPECFWVEDGGWGSWIALVVPLSRVCIPQWRGSHWPRRPDSPLLGGVFKADHYHRFLFLALPLLGHKMPNPFCQAGENQIVSALEPMQCMAVSLNECLEVKRGPERNWGHSLVLCGPRA